MEDFSSAYTIDNLTNIQKQNLVFPFTNEKVITLLCINYFSYLIKKLKIFKDLSNPENATFPDGSMIASNGEYFPTINPENLLFYNQPFKFEPANFVDFEKAIQTKSYRAPSVASSADIIVN